LQQLEWAELLLGALHREDTSLWGFDCMGEVGGAGSCRPAHKPKNFYLQICCQDGGNFTKSKMFPIVSLKSDDKIRFLR